MQDEDQESQQEGAELITLADALREIDAKRERAERRAKRAASRAAELYGIENAAEWRRHLLYDAKGKPRATPGNVIRCLEGDETFHGALVKDAFRGRWSWRRKPLHVDIVGPFPRDMTDSDASYVSLWLEAHHEVACGLSVVSAQLGAYAARHEVDELRSYLESIEWDGRPRIDTWLQRCLGVEDTPYARAVGRRWLIAGAARGLQPGVKADCMLILEGPQGAKKSSALQALGGTWHTDSLPIDIESKDAVVVLGGKWIVEWGEFDRYGKADQSTIKDFVSKRTDTIRPPYGRFSEDWPRRAIFVGTTNEDGYLQDPTGGRRWWPVRVGAIDLAPIRKYRDQIWAEAVAAYRAWVAAADDEQHPDYVRCQWWLTSSEDALRQAETDARYIGDPWDQRLRQYLDGRVSVLPHEALAYLDIPVGRATQADARRLARVLRHCGWERQRAPRVAGEPRGWHYAPRRPAPVVPPAAEEDTIGGLWGPQNVTEVTRNSTNSEKLETGGTR